MFPCSERWREGHASCCFYIVFFPFCFTLRILVQFSLGEFLFVSCMQSPNVSFLSYSLLFHFWNKTIWLIQGFLDYLKTKQNKTETCSIFLNLWDNLRLTLTQERIFINFYLFFDTLKLTRFSSPFRSRFLDKYRCCYKFGVIKNSV